MIDLFFTSRAEEEGENHNDKNPIRKQYSNYDEDEEIEKASPNKNTDEDDELDREDQMEDGIDLDSDNHFDLAFGDNNNGTRETIIHKESGRASRSNRYEIKEDDETAELNDILVESEEPEVFKVEEEVKEEEQ